MVNTKITYEAGMVQIKTTVEIWTEFSFKESSKIIRKRRG
jgi:hypothetical protein